MTFEELYIKYKDMVYNITLNYTQCVEDAQEITQDVFVAAHFAFKKFESKSNMSTWLYRIAINQSLDFLKAKKRKRRFAIFTSIFFKDSFDIKHNLTEFNHQGVQLEHKEALSKLFKQINNLPDNQKTALILHKLEQKTQEEVAEIMKLSKKAVESLIQRAKTNLSKKINAQSNVLENIVNPEKMIYNELK